MEYIFEMCTELLKYSEEKEDDYTLNDRKTFSQNLENQITQKYMETATILKEFFKKIFRDLDCF